MYTVVETFHNDFFAHCRKYTRDIKLNPGIINIVIVTVLANVIVFYFDGDI